MCLLLVALALAPECRAVPLGIHVLDTEYKTYVYSKFFTNGIEFVEQSRLGESAGPISDVVYGSYSPNWPDHTNLVQASANTARYGLEVYTGSTCPVPDAGSSAGALTAVTFSPLTGGPQDVRIEFTGWNQWYFSTQYASLVDLTTDQEVWSYGNVFLGSSTEPINSPLLPTNTTYGTLVPWIDLSPDPGDPGPRAMAILETASVFDVDHRYKLTLFAQSGSNPPDKQKLLVEWVIPEPSILVLLSLGSALLLFGRRHKTAP